MSRSLKFARMFERALRDGKLVDTGGWYRVDGQFVAPACLAKVSIHIPKRFQAVKRVPPVIVCREPWMRDDQEWHNSRRGGLCWVLHNLWRDKMSWKGKSNARIMSEGFDWLMRDAGVLITRHYLANLEGLVEWDSSWDFWGHEAEGVRQYERGKAGRRQAR